VTNPATAEWPAAMVASRPASEPVRTAVTTPIIPAVVRKAGQYPLRKLFDPGLEHAVEVTKPRKDSVDSSIRPKA
jgi:hypothetical protein